MCKLTYERLIELLDYCPETGHFTWKSSRGRAGSGVAAGRKTNFGYMQIRIDGRLYLSHRLAWLHVNKSWPENEIDHIDCVRDNNKISNLRDVPRRVNRENRRKAQSNNRSTGLLGSYMTGTDGRYMARIRVHGKVIHLGIYETADAAHQAYISAKRQLHDGNTL